MEKLLTELEKEAAKVGLYMREVSVGTPDQSVVAEGEQINSEKVIQALKDGKEFVVVATFSVGDLAWSDRILNPEDYEVKKEFKKIVPNINELREDALRRIAESGSLLDENPDEYEFDDDEDDLD